MSKFSKDPLKSLSAATDFSLSDLYNKYQELERRIGVLESESESFVKSSAIGWRAPLSDVGSLIAELKNSVENIEYSQKEFDTRLCEIEGKFNSGTGNDRFDY